MQFLNKEFLDGGISLLKEEKGKICISIIVPVYYTPSERNVDRIILKRAFLKAKWELINKYQPKQIDSYLSAIDKMSEKIDITHSSEGLGIYLSSDINLLIRFSFPVTEKVYVGDRFLIRDALFQLSYSFPYYVLLLTEERAQLYQGQAKELIEVKSDQFPFFNLDDYEYSSPARGSSYTGSSPLQAFEKDPSVLEEIRVQNFLHKVDVRLEKYKIDSLPLVICGELKEVAYFKEITEYNKQISSFIVGNYQHLSGKELAELVWPGVKSDLEEKRSLLIQEFKEKINTGLTESGIENIWRAVKEKRAFRLMVEKDYTVSCYYDSGNDTIYLQKPAMPCEVLPYAVDEVMDRTLEQGGEVIFVENGKLEEYQHIALFTRY